MDDALAVRVVQGGGDLAKDRDDLLDRELATRVRLPVADRLMPSTHSMIR